MFDEGEVDQGPLVRGGRWSHERWWYKLAQVCRRWRCLLLVSAQYLRLCHLCTYGTPIVEVLAHSPPLPLVVDHMEGDVTMGTKDEHGVLLALQHCHRVRRIRLHVPLQSLRKFIAAMGKEFPILEFLYVALPEGHNTTLILPETFQGPRLCHLALIQHFNFPIGSPIFATATGLVTLALESVMVHPSIHSHFHKFLQRLSLMSQLRKLKITFRTPLTDDDTEERPSHVPTVTNVTLPKLQWLGFKGTSACMEKLLPCITAPLLAKLDVIFDDGLPSSVPYLLHAISSTGNLRFSKAYVGFHEEHVDVTAYRNKKAKTYTLGIRVTCGELDTQIASAAQIFNTLRELFSSTERLFFRCTRSIEWWRVFIHANRTQWHDLLRSFNTVKTLRVPQPLVTELSDALQVHDEELPTELLPELNVLIFSPDGDPDNEFVSFIDSRKNVGRPVTLIRRGW